VDILEWMLVTSQCNLTKKIGWCTDIYFLKICILEEINLLGSLQKNIYIYVWLTQSNVYSQPDIKISSKIQQE